MQVTSAHNEVLTFAGVARQLGWASLAFCDGLRGDGVDGVAGKNVK